MSPVPAENERFLYAAELPEEIDWYKLGKVTRPYNQEYCGSCWAFSAVAAMESLEAIQGSGELRELSVQQLVDCDEDNSACTGGWMWQAYNYAKNNGVALRNEYAYDYLGRKGTCMYHSSQAAFNHPEMGMIEQDLNTNTQLKTIVSQHPISIAIYSSGMLARFK